ncbi:hypothetical protein CS063_01430 [Sporanaerobium hydrogeniformans]|uniref:Uncharacterized protein n=1 Tax=Sporanaerobium hydrogeniformans TaxID=3072179 RepID=A0AC61DFZ8_9FIRM|nr:hypothetical protein [Sporanaerobium hydrogeniformans]PHV72164.1 hypothetical protein CS063_01430 [Sporanaerobium hydrogeniformans]
MSFYNYPKILSAYKALQRAYENPYFNMDAFCTHIGLSREQIDGFYLVSSKIIDGDLNLAKDLNHELNSIENTADQIYKGLQGSY